MTVGKNRIDTLGPINPRSATVATVASATAATATTYAATEEEERDTSNHFGIGSGEDVPDHPTSRGSAASI
jgi:hypothetical protein